MSGPRLYLLLALAAAVATHLALVRLTPALAMDAAVKRLFEVGMSVNAFTPAARIDENARAAKRPSPDLALSVCPYDLADGPLRIAAARWDAPWSLSLYSAGGANYFTLNDRDTDGAAELALHRQGRRAPDDAARAVASPTRTGVAIIRRLAPNRERYEAATQVAAGDVCAGYVAP